MGGTFAGSNSHDTLKSAIKKHNEPILSELPLFLNNTATLDVPVYTVWGACEDVRVLEKFRSGEYKVENLNIVDEHDSCLLEVGGLKLRLLGLGGAVVMHKLFDNGEGKTTIAGGQGTMWTTVLQMGELIETALATFDRSETRIFVSHMSSGREGLLAQLALALRVLTLEIYLTLGRFYYLCWSSFPIRNLLQRFLCQSQFGSLPQPSHCFSLFIFRCLGYCQTRSSSYRPTTTKETHR